MPARRDWLFGYVPAVAQADEIVGPADDYVIEQVDAKEPCGLDEVLRYGDVLGARSGVGRGVIVKHNDVGSGLDDGGPEDLGGPDNCAM